MVIFPNAKINLGLRITSKREDGFHNLDTVFYPIPLYDILEIIPQQNNIPATACFSSSGDPIPGDSAQNLCMKAYSLLKKDFPHLPSIDIHLFKNIPMGAGMGGGSSDGASTISALNQLFALDIQVELQKKYALDLGSDCPFFIENIPVHATGRGELMKPIACNLSKHSIVLMSPGIHINTKEAFSQIIPSPNALSCAAIVAQPIQKWKDLLVNDFEKSVFAVHPQLAQSKAELYALGAQYASMTGSGSTIYGIFEKSPETAALEALPYGITLIEMGKARKFRKNGDC